MSGTGVLQLSVLIELPSKHFSEIKSQQGHMMDGKNCPGEDAALEKYSDLKVFVYF